MIEIMSNGQIYNVYTSTAEVKGMTIKNLNDCEVGDYARFINGYYAPCLSKEYKEVGRNKYKVYYFKFPGMQFKVSVARSHLNVNYVMQKDKPTHLSIRDYTFVELLTRGMDIVSASKIAYKVIGMNKVLSKMYNGQIFDLIIKRYNMKTLSDEIKNKGITIEVLAEEIAKLVKDPKANPTLKKWALEYSIKVHDSNTSSNSSDNPLQEASSALLGEMTNIPSNPSHN